MSGDCHRSLKGLKKWEKLELPARIVAFVSYRWKFQSTVDERQCRSWKIYSNFWSLTTFHDSRQIGVAPFSPRQEIILFNNVFSYFIFASFTFRCVNKPFFLLIEKHFLSDEAFGGFFNICVKRLSFYIVLLYLQLPFQ